MNPKTTSILLIVFVLAIIALLLTQMQSGPGASTIPPNPDAAANIDQPILRAEQLGNDLMRITLDGGLMGTLLELERVNGRWWVSQPSRFPANPAAVDELLGLLAGLSGRPTEQDGGLVPDASGVMLADPDGETSIWFSSRLGAGRAILTLSKGDQYQNYIAQDTLHDLFDTLDTAVFYAKKIDPPLTPEVARVEVTLPGGTSVLTQRDGRWWIGENANAERALEDELEQKAGVSNYFKLITKLELSEPQHDTGADGLARFGLADPLIRARFVPFDDADHAGASGLELRVGVPADPLDEQRYVAVGGLDATRPAVFKAPTQIALALGVDATAFRDPRVLITPPTLIESIDLKCHVVLGEGPEIVRESIAFRPDGPPVLTTLTTRHQEQRTLSREKCARMLSRLSSARALEFVPFEPGKWARKTSVTVHATLGGEPEAFSVYTAPQDEPGDNGDDGTVYYVRRGEEPVAIEVERSAVADLFWPLDLFEQE